MSQLILARGNTYRKNIFKRFIPNMEIGPYFLVFSLIIFVILVTVLTLVFSTRQVTKGYVLNKLESEHDKLIKQSEQNEMQISKVKALKYIEDSTRVRRMTRPGQIVFIGEETSIASR
jgi:energy-converting hydrogenase Eha subunit H